MKFLLGCNMKMSLIGVGENEPLLGGGGDKNLVGWCESTRGIFPGEEMSNFSANRGKDSLPIPSSRKNSVYT